MRRPAVQAVAFAAIAGVVVAAFTVPAGAHVNNRVGHVYSHIKARLSQTSVINDASNAVDWSQLKGVPAEIADGDDATGEADLLAASFGVGGDPAPNPGTDFTTLTASQTSITVPAGQQAVLIATFTAESLCTGGGGWCSVRLVVSGVGEMLPATGTDFAFDSSDGGAEGGSSWEGHAVSRHSPVLSAGTYTVSVEYARVGPTTFRLDDWHLTVERVRAS